MVGLRTSGKVEIWHRYMLTNATNADPCTELLEKYTNCVASHPLGLRQDEDCGVEAAAYKQCRKDTKKEKAEKPKKE